MKVTMKYKHIEDIVEGYHDIVFENPITKEPFFLAAELESDDIEIFLKYKEEYSGCIWQCKRSDNNKNNDVNSKWSDDYLLESLHDPKSDFDESVNVYESPNNGACSALLLAKITSKDFIKKLKSKLSDYSMYYYSHNEGDYFDDFSTWLHNQSVNPNEYYPFFNWDIESFIRAVGGSEEDRLEIFEDYIDENGNLILWFSFYQLELENFEIGYRNISASSDKILDTSDVAQDDFDPVVKDDQFYEYFLWNKVKGISSSIVEDFIEDRERRIYGVNFIHYDDDFIGNAENARLRDSWEKRLGKKEIQETFNLLTEDAKEKFRTKLKSRINKEKIELDLLEKQDQKNDQKWDKIISIGIKVIVFIVLFMICLVIYGS